MLKFGVWKFKYICEKQELAKQFIHTMFTESQLVGFGNYLLCRYNVQEHSTDGKNTPLFQRQVSDADFRNWIDENPIKENTYLPSQFNIGDKVLLSIKQSFGDNPYPFTANVLAVHFYAAKVKYDLEIPIAEEPPTRIYNIDSCFVLPAES